MGFVAFRANDKAQTVAKAQVVRAFGLEAQMLLFEICILGGLGDELVPVITVSACGLGKTPACTCLSGSERQSAGRLISFCGHVEHVLAILPGGIVSLFG